MGSLLLDTRIDGGRRAGCHVLFGKGSIGPRDGHSSDREKNQESERQTDLGAGS